MAKQPTPTFHPLAVAKSLTAQNEAIGLVLMHIQTAASLAPVIEDSAKLRLLINELHVEAERCRAIMWPDEGET